MLTRLVLQHERNLNCEIYILQNSGFCCRHQEWNNFRCELSARKMENFDYICSHALTCSYLKIIFTILDQTCWKNSHIWSSSWLDVFWTMPLWHWKIFSVTKIRQQRVMLLPALPSWGQSQFHLEFLWHFPTLWGQFSSRLCKTALNCWNGKRRLCAPEFPWTQSVRILQASIYHLDRKWISHCWWCWKYEFWAKLRVSDSSTRSSRARLDPFSTFHSTQFHTM